MSVAFELGRLAMGKRSSDTSDVLATGMGAGAGGYGMHELIKPTVAGPGRFSEAAKAKLMSQFRGLGMDPKGVSPNRLTPAVSAIADSLKTKVYPATAMGGNIKSLKAIVARLLAATSYSKTHPALIGAGAVAGGLGGLLGSRLLSRESGIQIPQLKQSAARRELSEKEQKSVAKAKTKIMPSIMPLPSSPIESAMSSPGWSGAAGGAIGAGLGGLIGNQVGRTQNLGGSKGGHPVAGAVLGGGLGALAGYLSRLYNNDHVEESMRHTGPDASMHDLYSDPAHVSRSLQRAIMGARLGR